MSVQPTIDLRLVSVAEAAELTNLSRETIYQLVRDGELQHVRVGTRGKVLKIRLASLEAWVTGQPQPDVPVPAKVTPFRGRAGERRV